MANFTFSQRISVSGTVLDADNDEPLLGATIYHKGGHTGTYSDENGEWKFQISPSKKIDTLIIVFIGYDTARVILDNRYGSNTHTKFTVRMEALTCDCKTEVIYITDVRDIVDKNQMSHMALSIDRIKSLPVFFGETDVLKTLQLLPGIQSGSEASAGLYVRGGGPDQNLIIFDDAPLYSVSHLFGFFSIFNGDVVKGVDLYKGAFPSRYGGRLSSVVDIKPRRGNMEEFHVSGGIGLISSRLAFEGPIVNDRVSFLIAGRRTYVDLFTKQVNKWNATTEDYQEIPDYFFHDFNGRIDWKVGENDRISLSGYAGDDQFNYTSGRYSLDFGWQNKTSTLAWEHFNPGKSALRVSGIFNRFDYDIVDQYVTHEVKVFSDIRDFTGKVDYTWLPHKKHSVQMGGSWTHHTFTPRGVTGELNYATFDLNEDARIMNHEFAAYLSDNISFTQRTQLSVGMRLSGQLTSDTAFFNPEPRISFMQKLDENVSLKMSYSRMAQYLHLISNSSLALPTDIWYPSTRNALPEISDQIALGTTALLFDQNIEVSFEAFAKQYQNLVEYKEGTQFLFSDDIENDITFGRGWGYGGELFIQKRMGDFTGWLGYTLSWNFRQFDDINRGEVYPSKFDRRHDVSVVGSWEISPKITVSATWIFGTGGALTLPQGLFYFQDLNYLGDEVVTEYSGRNAYRMPNYHRMDLGCVWNIKPEKGKNKLAFNIFNAYNRRNTFFIYYELETDVNGNGIRYVPKQISLFPVLPSVAWNFNF